jgi:predicted MPP superfamily phosphohydrolase
MEKKITRRKFLTQAAGALITAVGIGAGGYTYANQIEPRMLDIVNLQMVHPLIPKSFDGITIAQFSDTHIGFQYSISEFANLVTKINALHPNIILFTGDLMDEPNKFPDIHQLVPLLKQLHAPLGKYCIYGNHDHGGYGSDIYRNLMEHTGFNVLLNEATQIRIDDRSSISLAGIDDAMLGRPDFNLALKKVPVNQFCLLLSHAPDLANTAQQHQVHWQLSGHSHGGQVKIPFIGALVTPPFAQVYTEGFYKIGETNSLSLYVNRGIGTTRLPFRFMAHPELTIFTMKSG